MDAATREAGAERELAVWAQVRAGRLSTLLIFGAAEARRLTLRPSSAMREVARERGRDLGRGGCEVAATLEKDASLWQPAC